MLLTNQSQVMKACHFAGLVVLITIVFLDQLTIADEIHTAARSGNLSQVKKILEKSPNSINKPDPGNGYTPLHWAINYSKHDVVKHLIDQGANVNAKTTYGYTPAHLAAMGANAKIIGVLLAKKPNVNIKDNRGFTPIMYAVTSNNNAALIDKWIDAGADLKVTNRQKQSLLHIACTYGKQDLARKLINQGMPYDQPDQYGNTPLFSAAARNQLEIVKLLLEKGANVNIVSKNTKHTLLHSVCQSGALDSFKLIIDKAEDVNATNNQGQTAIMLASYARQPEMVKALLEKGADPNIVSKDGYMTSALHAACVQCMPEAVEALLGKKAKVSNKDLNGDTPLHVAARGGHSQYPQPLTDESRKKFAKIVQMLLKANANINVKNKQEATPLSLAIGRQNFLAVDAMIPKTEDFSFEVPGEASILHWACRHGLRNSVKLVTKKSSDSVNKQDRDGKSSFFLACEGGHHEIVAILLKLQPQIDLKCSTGETPLLAACWNGHIDVVKQLLESGANLEITDAGGQTALHMAAWSGHKELVELLMKKGIKPDVKTGSGYTPLHAAAWQGHDAIVDLLVKSGCDVDVADNDGVTPLHKAIRAGKFETVKSLMALKADPNKKDEFGFDAFDKSKNSKNQDIVAFFSDR